MEPFVYVAGGAIVVGVVIAAIVIKHKKTNMRSSQLLEECFGKPMQTNELSLSEVHKWIKSREHLLTSGAKAAVLKANEDVLKSVGKKLDIGTGNDHFIIMAIIDNNQIIESTLVKYDKLDNDINDLLGDQGIVIIES